MTEEEARLCYPAQAEVEEWIEGIWQGAMNTPYETEASMDTGLYSAGPWHLTLTNRVMKFSPKGLPEFYGLWQPASSGPAPLLVHLPGYGGEMSLHAELVAQGFHVLSLSPLGYWTPSGMDQEKMEGPYRPVLPDTIRSKGQHGYREWLMECIMAVQWAWKQENVIPGRVSFYGSSQGGGTALLLGSLFSGRGVRCVGSDEPYLTNFPKADFRGAYDVARKPYDEAEDQKAAWHAMGLVDTLSHAHRLHFPVMLVEGGRDTSCPPDTIEPLYELLPDVKAKFYLPEQYHGATRAAMPLFAAWFRLYA